MPVSFGQLLIWGINSAQYGLIPLTSEKCLFLYQLRTSKSRSDHHPKHPLTVTSVLPVPAMQAGGQTENSVVLLTSKACCFFKETMRITLKSTSVLFHTPTAAGMPVLNVGFTHDP